MQNIEHLNAILLPFSFTFFHYYLKFDMTGIEKNAWKGATAQE